MLFRSPRGGPAIAVLRRYHGRILLLPADAFANARLANGPATPVCWRPCGASLGDHWTFDEYHHGLIAGQAVETAALGRTLDLILLHLAVLYLVALWTLSRRFGPAWSEPPAVTGSTGSFLLGLGALHHRLGPSRGGGAPAARAGARARPRRRPAGGPRPPRRHRRPPRAGRAGA